MTVTESTLTNEDVALGSVTLEAPSLLDLVRVTTSQREGSATRADLQAVALKHGFDPHEFTAKLRRLREQHCIPDPYEIVSPVYPGRPTHVYAPNGLDAEALERWGTQVEAEHRFLSTKEQKKAGEQYARGVLRRARDEDAPWFGRITQTERLGHIAIGDGLKADLLLEYDFSGAHFREALVEVKNAREHYDISNAIFPKLMQAALDTNRLPAMVLAHVSPRAAAFCQHTGIALLHLGRRIVEKKRRSEARTVFGARADGEFQFVRLKRIFTEPISPDIRRHIQHVRERDWIAHADARWYENHHRLQQIIDLLRNGEWQRAAREIASESPPEGF